MSYRQQEDRITPPTALAPYPGSGPADSIVFYTTAKSFGDAAPGLYKAFRYPVVIDLSHNIDFFENAKSRLTTILSTKAQNWTYVATFAITPTLFLSEMDKLRRLKADWDSYGADAPNSLAIDSAENALLGMHQAGLAPDRVAPSAEGGVGICFYQGRKYADIEFRNSGEILALTSDGSGNPRAWEVSPVKIHDALKKIREHLSS